MSLLLAGAVILAGVSASVAAFVFKDPQHCYHHGVPDKSYLFSKCQSPSYFLSLLAASEEGSPREVNDDDEDIPIKPYRSRSLAWTKRYRKLNPYEKCRQRVLQFGHRSKDDWDEAMESGQLGQYVPSYPDEMYEPEWDSWEEWLGLMRSYEETQSLARNVLHLKSLDDYILFVRSNPKRAEGLRIPVRPDLFYKMEWTGEAAFFCSS